MNLTRRSRNQKESGSSHEATERGKDPISAPKARPQCSLGQRPRSLRHNGLGLKARNKFLGRCCCGPSALIASQPCASRGSFTLWTGWMVYSFSPIFLGTKRLIALGYSGKRIGGWRGRRIELPVSFWKLIPTPCAKRSRGQGETGISAEGRAQRVMPDFSLTPAKRAQPVARTISTDHLRSLFFVNHPPGLFCKGSARLTPPQALGRWPRLHWGRAVGPEFSDWFSLQEPNHRRKHVRCLAERY